jgi:hypothetical protein
LQRDALNPGLVTQRCASVDSGTHCVQFRAGQRLVDPLGPAGWAGQWPRGEAARIAFGLSQPAVERTPSPVLGSLNQARPLRPHVAVLPCRQPGRDLLSRNESWHRHPLRNLWSEWARSHQSRH